MENSIIVNCVQCNGEFIGKRNEPKMCPECNKKPYMDKIIEYIKNVPRSSVCVEITLHDVKVVYGYDKKVYDIMSIKEFEERCGK